MPFDFDGDGWRNRETSCVPRHMDVELSEEYKCQRPAFASRRQRRPAFSLYRRFQHCVISAVCPPWSCQWLCLPRIEPTSHLRPCSTPISSSHSSAVPGRLVVSLFQPSFRLGHIFQKMSLCLSRFRRHTSDALLSCNSRQHQQILASISEVLNA